MSTSRAETLVSDTDLEKSAAPSVRDSVSREKDGGIAVEKTSTDDARLENGEAKIGREEVDDTEYPKAMKMVMIVVALVLSIFLVALDMTIVVSSSHLGSSPSVS
jgi:hypothetical protein